MCSRKVTAATIDIPSELVEKGFRARSEYEVYKRNLAAKEERVKERLQAEEEKKRLQQVIKEDSNRKKQLKLLNEKEKHHKEKANSAKVRI